MLKNLSKLFGITAFAALIGLSLSGCSNPADENNNGDPPRNPQTAAYASTDMDGNRYTLTVMEDADRAARYTAQTGDRFELKIELYNDGN
jgi:hypothetical protein